MSLGARRSATRTYGAPPLRLAAFRDKSQVDVLRLGVPMKVRLPLWIQSAAIWCLIGVWVSTVGWASFQGSRFAAQFGREPYWNSSVENSLFVYIPFCIFLLGCRFVYRFRESKERTSRIDRLLYRWVGYTVAGLFLYLLLGIMLPQRQRVREAGGLYAQTTRLPSNFQ